MELTIYKAQYYALNPAHLADDELHHELQAREYDFHDESRSKQERLLRSLLKAEKEKPRISFAVFWTSPLSEMEWCDKKLTDIRTKLEGLKRKAPDQALKTRLLHIFFRMERLQPHTKEDADLSSIAMIAGECLRLLSRYFSISSPLPEVREAEATFVNESLKQIREHENQLGTEVMPVQTIATHTRTNLRDESVSRRKSVDEEEMDGAVGGENVGGEKTVDRVAQLVAENERLNDMVRQLIDRIAALEASKAVRETNKQIAPIKPSDSTHLGNDSRQNENEEDRDSVDFYNWVKQKYGSIESLGGVQVQQSDERKEQDSSGRMGTVNRSTNNQRLPVHKWSVRYDGMDNGRRLNEFLKEVDFNARSEGFTEAELFLSAHHLFTRKARGWFMEVNGNNELETWEKLVTELKSEFLPVDIDYQYERLANARKQGPREKFQDFYLDMVRIFRGMSKQWEDIRKFEVLFRNTREDCRTAMLAAGVDSIPKMRDFGKRFDSINWQIYQKKDSKYSPRGNSQIEELGQKPSYDKNSVNKRFQGSQPGGYQGRNYNPNYKPVNKQVQQVDNQGSGRQKGFQTQSSKQENASRPERKPIEPKPGSSGTNPLQRIVKAYIPIKRGVCFNCHEDGHGFQDCEQEKHVFCENCGFPGFATRECPFCNSKNEKRTAQ